MRPKGILAIGLGAVIYGTGLPAYEEPVHLTITAAAAEFAGFSPSDAFEIAKYDWGTDDDPTTDPMTRSLSAVERARGLKARRDFHFVTDARLGELSASADRACSGAFGSVQQKAVGQYLHALEDSYSHRDYDPELGHLTAGTSPDKPWNDPGGLREMFARKFNALLRLRGRCITVPNRAVTAIERFERATKILDTWVRAESQAGLGDVFLGNERRWENTLRQLLGADFDRLTIDTARRYREWLAQQRAKGWPQ